MRLVCIANQPLISMLAGDFAEVVVGARVRVGTKGVTRDVAFEVVELE